MKMLAKFGALAILLSSGLLHQPSLASDFNLFNTPFQFTDTTDPIIRHQLQLLAQAERKINSLKNSYDFSPLVLKGRMLKVGDTSSLIIKIKQRLFLLGDFQNNHPDPVFDSALYQSILHFQNRNGLAPKGFVDRLFIHALNMPLDTLLKKIKSNANKWEQLSLYTDSVVLMVNIPDFILHVYEHGREVKKMKVIVGKPSHPTARFEGNLKYVVFCPYWNIPPGILKKEIFPEMAKHHGYLFSHHMEWHGNGIRQLPGKDNALGDVKFLFPNRYHIYMHDTPIKNLFSQHKRAYSHGCIRLEDATWLAEFVMAKELGWDASMVKEKMAKGKESYHQLSESVRVLITYFTVWVDGGGELQIRDDLYHLDHE